MSIVYVSYILRVYFEIYSGLDAAKLLLFSEICKKNREKMRFLDKR